MVVFLMCLNLNIMFVVFEVFFDVLIGGKVICWFGCYVDESIGI